MSHPSEPKVQLFLSSFFRSEIVTRNPLKSQKMPLYVPRRTCKGLQEALIENLITKNVSTDRCIWFIVLKDADFSLFEK